MRAKSLTPSLIYYGVDVPPPEKHPLRAGPLSMVYEAGEIRYIKVGVHEIVRRIYLTLRDQNWGTILPLVSNLQILAQSDHFELTFEARHRQLEIDFSWRGRVSGDQQGVVTFFIEGKANSTFRQCRVGLCVLHPIRELAGTSCLVEHSDGSRDQCRFPWDVSPHQPFTDIRSITQKVSGAMEAKVRFEGAVFEMEDQRNWTDGSFKTYSPPLAIPYPSEVAEGSKVLQSVTVELSPYQARPPIQAATSAPVLTIQTEPSAGLPEIGLAFGGDCGPLQGRKLERVAQVRPAHLRVDLQLSQPLHVSVLEKSWQEAMALGTCLHAGLIISGESQLKELLRTLQEVRPTVGAWLLFNSQGCAVTAEIARLARKLLMGYDDKALVGTGSNLNFVELNRERPAFEDIDFLCYPANPQNHQSDNATLVEALDAQGWTVASAKKFANSLPTFVTPVTFVPRHRADMSDPRQTSLFGAAWTLGSLKYLAESGAASVTYFETQGAEGIQTARSLSGNGPCAPAEQDSVFPLYHVLADACEFAGAQVVATRSSQPLRVEGLTLRKENLLRFLCANLTARRESIVIEGLPLSARNVHLYRLDEDNAAQAMQSPEEFRARPGMKVVPTFGNLELDLPPFAIVRIDAEVGP